MTWKFVSRVKSCSEIVKRACSFNRYLRVRMYLLTYVYYTYAEKVCKRKLLQIFYMPAPCLQLFIQKNIEKKNMFSWLNFRTIEFIYHNISVDLLVNPENCWGLVFFNFQLLSIQDQIYFGAHNSWFFKTTRNFVRNKSHTQQEMAILTLGRWQ